MTIEFSIRGDLNTVTKKIPIEGTIKFPDTSVHMTMKGEYTLNQRQIQPFLDIKPFVLDGTKKNDSTSKNDGSGSKIFVELTVQDIYDNEATDILEIQFD